MHINIRNLKPYKLQAVDVPIKIVKPRRNVVLLSVATSPLGLSSSSSVTSPLKSIGGPCQRKEEDEGDITPQRSKGLTRSKTGKTPVLLICSNTVERKWW